MFYILQPYLFFYIHDHLHILYLEDIFVFFSFMPIMFEIVCLGVPIHGTNAHELNRSPIFYIW